ncbi:bacteriohemerythrin [Campylobacterota bacterium]
MLITQEQLPTIELSSMNDIHNEEIALITKLHTVAKNHETEAVVDLLNELIEHTAKHFASEEKLMQEAQFPDYHIHKHEHAKQLMDIQSIRSFFEMTNDTQSIAAYMHDSLTPWIIEHVENYDSSASEFLKEK